MNFKNWKWYIETIEPLNNKEFNEKDFVVVDGITMSREQYDDLQKFHGLSEEDIHDMMRDLGKKFNLEEEVKRKSKGNSGLLIESAELVLI